MTLVLEMFSTSKRTLFGIGIEVVWVIVLASMSPLAYFIKQWREIRLFIFVTLGVLSLASIWLLQESIRWLISVENVDKAQQIVNHIIKCNKLSTSTQQKQDAKFSRNRKRLNQMFYELKFYNESQKQANELSSNEPTADIKISKRSHNTVVDLIKHPKFRLYVLIMALNWFATSLVYDGLTYMNNYIGENIFFNWIAMNMIELPAQVVCYLVISRYGRRLTVSVTLILAGFILLMTCLDVFEAIEQLVWFKFVMFVMAKFIVTQSYSAIILHSPELFPTNLRYLNFKSHF